MTGVEVPLGDGRVEVPLPDRDATVAEPPGDGAVDLRAAVEPFSRRCRR